MIDNNCTALERRILRTALQNHDREHRTDPGEPSIYRFQISGRYSDSPEGFERHAKSAWCKALDRLEALKLVKHVEGESDGTWSGADLTDAGIKLARRLIVDQGK